MPGDGSPTDGANREVDVLLVCSAGGHLMQLYLLRSAWEDPCLRHAWVTLDRADARTLLRHEDVTYAYSPTTRNLKNLVRNACLAWRVIRARRPRAIVTTGAGLAVPFAWIGRLLGVSVVYVESLTRIERPSLSCNLVRPVAARVYGQWPELAASTRGMRYAGQVTGTP
jgi:beta-1,4-N-acetylglucosaminyltransferase